MDHSYRAKKYYRRKFNNWREKVKVRIPSLVIQFYKLKEEKKINGYEHEILLGTVIKDLYSPTYGLNDIASEVMLEILVEDLFKLVYRKK